MADEEKRAEAGILKFFPETRTVIVCWMMVSSFIIIILCWWRSPPAEAQLLNTLIGMYVGTGFITAITWWMGSSKGSDANNKMVDKLTSDVRPESAPVVPTPWWPAFTSTEQNYITASAINDPRVDAFVKVAATGRGTVADLAYLVSKGLLTQARADQIVAT